MSAQQPSENMSCNLKDQAPPRSKGDKPSSLCPHSRQFGRPNTVRCDKWGKYPVVTERPISQVVVSLSTLLKHCNIFYKLNIKRMESALFCLKLLGYLTAHPHNAFRNVCACKCFTACLDELCMHTFRCWGTRKKHLCTGYRVTFVFPHPDGQWKTPGFGNISF